MVEKRSKSISISDRKATFTTFHIQTKDLKKVSSAISRVRPYGARSRMANAEKVYVKKGKRVTEISVSPSSIGYAISMRDTANDEKKYMDAQRDLRKKFMGKVFRIMKDHDATVVDYEKGKKVVSVSEYLK